MKRLIFFLLLLSSAGFVMSGARALGAGGDDSGAQQKLMQMERDWANAMIKNENLFTDVFVERNAKWQAVASHSIKVRAGM